MDSQLSRHGVGGLVADRNKVLIVDTDPNRVRELSVALRERGCQTFEATTFQDAKKTWIAERPSMLVADIRLGEFNGLQLLLRAKTDRPDLIAVITSAYPDKMLEAETQRFGGTFLLKPISLTEIVNIVLDRRGDATVAADLRRGERRQTVTPGFAPDKRIADRRQRATRP